MIGILVQLLIPALLASREKAERTQCQHNLKQLAIAWSLHENRHDHLPTGGWGWRWFADAERGFGEEQPGGWCFNILPFIGEESRHHLAAGANDEERRVGSTVLAATAVKLFNCPSRRRTALYPRSPDVVGLWFNIDPLRIAAHNDYAANAGDSGPGWD